jgi:hypothetical protein
MEMTIILPKPTDTKPTEDWREGLVLPTDHPNHVYGKTALTQQEWRALGHKLDDQGIRFVAVYTSRVRGTRTASRAMRHGEALGLFADGAVIVNAVFSAGAAHSSIGAVSVHRVDEWSRR